MGEAVSIFVTKSFLPPRDEFNEYVDKIWQNNQLTNQGPLLKEFEEQVKDYLGVTNFQFVANGTLALQLALRALDITNAEVITTPFSYVATTSSILWEGNKPVFVDIDPETLNIDPDKIEAAITERTKAILAVHVFGNPCDVERIQEIAEKHNLKIIYDGAHAFGVKYKGRSIFEYGDISICSFHATKLFHTIEGGGIFTRDNRIAEKIDLMKRFGHYGDEHIMLGINAKASEFQAAMGLSNIKHIDDIIAARARVTKQYHHNLPTRLIAQKYAPGVRYNYAYYPVIFKDEQELVSIEGSLEAKGIYPRRYFYPSLNTLPYVKPQRASIAEDIAVRILCLPLYSGLSSKNVQAISFIINDVIKGS